VVSSRCWTLSLPEVAFLWEECPRCFYLAVVHRFPRPRAAPSKVLSRIDEQLKASCAGRRTDMLAADIPAGVFDVGERSVESQPIDVHLPDTVHRCLIRGRLDTAIQLDDGGYAVVEFQAGENLQYASSYARQLHCYAYALEHAAPGAASLAPVTRLGIILFEPERFARGDRGLGVLAGGLSWIDIPRDDALLFGFLAEALAVLERADAPGGAPMCDWCVYRDASRRTGL
jgi:hypothetical protein